MIPPEAVSRPCDACGGADFRASGRVDQYILQRCRGCGLERLDPQPTPAALARVYGAHYYDAWGVRDDASAARAVKEATFEHLLRRVPPLPRGARVLDCGAATGFFMNVAARAGWTPYGVELSEFGASQIAAQFGAQRVFQGPFEAAAFPELGAAPFQAVFMLDFLEHVHDPLAVLRKAHALLASGGWLVVTTPDAASRSRRLMGARWLHLKTEHLYYFTARALRLLVERAGFGTFEKRPAWKRMNVAYVTRQLQAYPHRCLTPVVRAANLCLPDSLKQLCFPALFGEMLVWTRKP